MAVIAAADSIKKVSPLLLRQDGGLTYSFVTKVV